MLSFNEIYNYAQEIFVYLIIKLTLKENVTRKLDMSKVVVSLVFLMLHFFNVLWMSLTDF